jgi:hypothetical protein
VAVELQLTQPCSKRAFQTQFRRWSFPPKQRPAYKDDRLVSRIKELWEKNLTQREMVRILNEEDGFDIKPRELMRVRARNRWLLRAPNGDGGDMVSVEDGDLTEGDEIQLSPPIIADLTSPATPRNILSMTGSDTQQGSDSDMTATSRRSRRKRQTAMQSVSEGDMGGPNRFPSEMKLDEARAHLNLPPEMYRYLRTQFQEICQDEHILKKTVAGASKWDAAKDRLMRQIPLIRSTLWSDKAQHETRQLALDVICTDVTKRVRAMEKGMTLEEAKNALGINPSQSRMVRTAFHKVLEDAGFTCKSNVTTQQWEELKQKWGDKSALVKQIMMDLRTDGGGKQVQARALEALAKDIIKRFREHRARKTQTSGQSYQDLPSSPTASPHAGQVSTASKLRDSFSRSSSNDGLDMTGGMGNLNFDAMAEVSHASQMTFNPASSNMGRNVSLSLRSPPAPALSDSQDGLPQPSRTFGPARMPPEMGLESQMRMSSSMLLSPRTHSFLDRPYAQPQFESAATSAPVFSQLQPPTTAWAIFLRRHPLSSSYVSSPNLWICTLTSHSLQELRQAAVQKAVPGTVCIRVEGVLKDEKGCELSLPIEQDEELGAYLAHLQGRAPTFNVQLA